MVMEKHVMRLMNVLWEQMRVLRSVQIQMVDTTVAVNLVMILMLMDSLAMVTVLKNKQVRIVNNHNQ